MGDNQFCNVNYLPDEVLLCIFDKLCLRELNIAFRVCRRWSLLISRNTFFITEQNDLKRLAKGPIISIQALTILVKIKRPVTLIWPLSKLARNLQSITIQADTPLHISDIQTLAQLSRLAHLDVFMASGVLDSDVAKELRMPLQSIVLNNFIKKSYFDTLIAENNRLDLRELHMYGQCRLFLQSELKSLLHFCNFQLTDITLRCSDMNLQGYMEICKCKHLKSLRLYECWQLTVSAAVAIARLTNVTLLHMTGTRMLRRTGLATFLLNCTSSLNELVLSSSYFTDSHIAMLVLKQPNLRRLELWNGGLSSEGLVSLVLGLPQLTEVDVDIELSKEQLKEIDRHPSLVFIRCLTPSGYFDSKVVDANVKVAGPLLRTSGEGLRASLYYYWLQDAPLASLFSSKKHKLFWV